MATFLEPPPLASVAAVIGFAAMSLAIGMSGRSRASDPDQSYSARTPSADEAVSAVDGETPDRDGVQAATPALITGATVGEGTGSHE